MRPGLRVAPALLTISTLAIAATLARPAAAECAEFISEANTRTLFDALREYKGDDGCSLENVRTDRSKMNVEWKKGEALQAPILVTPASCAESAAVSGKVLSIVVPPAVAQACPGAVAKMTSLVKSETFGGLVQMTPPTPAEAAAATPSRNVWLAVVGGVAVVMFVGFGVLARRKAAERKGPAASTDAGAEANAEASASSEAAEPKAPEASADEASASEPSADEASAAKKDEPKAVHVNGVGPAKSNEISAAN